MSSEATASWRRVRACALALACGLAACSGSDDDGGDGDGDKPSAPERDAATGSPGAGGKDAGPSATGGSSGGRGGASGSTPSRSDAGGAGGTPAPGTDAGSKAPEPPQGCAGAPVDMPPEQLSCTGLYADIATKDVAARVLSFAPAVHLWSDGADKARWIYLPEGTKIDSSAPDDWKFPVGTKLFKEFSHEGHRVETRLFWKIGDNRWVKTSYHWNEDESEATRFAGGEVKVAGDTYYIPSAKECDQCHKGRDDRALGFEAGLLGMPGATGLTLAQLVDLDMLTDPPSVTSLAIADDGTGKAAAALGWLHVNCGVSCHNASAASEGYSSRLQLHLTAADLDGSGDPKAVAALVTTVGVAARTPRWLGKTRITPGSPEKSLVHELASMRNPARPRDQMPPIATRIVDPEGVRVLEDWIRSMPSMQ